MINESVGRRVGRPPLTDRSALLAAARKLGYTRLTVGSVTAAVGVKYSTFYRHFPRFDVLVTELTDQVCAEISLPDSDRSWQDTLRATCTAVRDLIEQHPGMAEALIAPPQLPDGVLAITTRLADTLLGAGFDTETAAAAAVYAVETVTMTQLGTAGLHHALTDHERGGTDTDEGAVRRSSVSPVAELIERSDGAWGDYKIELLIRGLEATYGTHRPGGTAS